MVRVRSFYDQGFIALVLAPVALVPEDVFKAETIAIADIELCYCACAARGKENLVRVVFQLMGKGFYIVDRLTGSDSPFGYVVDVIPAIPNVPDMFF